MSRNLIIGQYRPSDSLGHRLDPRAKLLIGLFLMTLSLFTASVFYYLAICALIFIMFLLSGTSLPVIVRNFKPIIFLMLITSLYHLIFSSRASDTLIEYYGIRLTEGGVYLAAVYSLRVLVFVGIAFFISLTTTPSDMAEAMVGWLKPLNKLGVPVNDIGLVIFMAMRFIPVLADEFDTIKKAQMVRGVDFSGGLIKRGKKMVYLLIPVFQAAIRRADDMAVAIESRGYISGARRSSYRRLRWVTADWLFFLLSLAIMISLYVIAGII